MRGKIGVFHWFFVSFQADAYGSTQRSAQSMILCVALCCVVVEPYGMRSTEHRVTNSNLTYYIGIQYITLSPLVWSWFVGKFLVALLFQIFLL